MIHIPLLKPTMGTTLKEGLISCWEFDETSGTTAYDSHGANDGVNNGALINQAGLLDKAYRSQGSNSNRIELPTGLIKGNSAITISMWVKFTSISGTQGLFSYWYSLGNQSVLIAINDGDIRYYTYSDDSFPNQVGGTFNKTFTTGVWQHLVCSYDGTTMRAYLDGIECSTTYSRTGVLGDSSDHEGYISNYYRSGGTTNSLNGYVDQTGAWSRALSLDEIQTLYNNGAGRAYQNW